MRFTDLLSLQELNAVKLDEQPLTVRCAGDQAAVVSLRYLFFNAFQRDISICSESISSSRRWRFLPRPTLQT